MRRALERYFEFERLGTNWRTEILAGATTFITMAYIIFVNPSILHEAGMPFKAVAAATCFCAAFGSIAMGIFAARRRFYRTSPLVDLDRRILEEEAQHQGMGVRIAADLVHDGRLTLEDVSEIVRSASDSVARLLVPTALFERFGVGNSSDERDRIVSSGILAMQRTTSQKAIMGAMRRLRRNLDGRRGDPHAYAA